MNSMSDLFHKAFPDDYFVRVAQVMQAAKWHTFQVLTKRPLRMQALLRGKLNYAAHLPNIWSTSSKVVTSGRFTSKTS